MNEEGSFPASEDEGITVYIPNYEEFATSLLETAREHDLAIDDVRHEIEPSSGERRFSALLRLNSAEIGSRYHAHLSFGWDALLTYVTVYGATAECELYHDDDLDCPHSSLVPQPAIELEGEFILGDGGYDLQSLEEANSWLGTVQVLLAKVFPEENRPSVHIGIVSANGTLIVEKLTAEYSWILDLSSPVDFAEILTQVGAVLAVVPQLADRLPI